MTVEEIVQSVFAEFGILPDNWEEIAYAIAWHIERELTRA